jgi:large subunit ribosomal protein L3
MKGLLAKKLGMTQLFNADGTTTAVTVLEAGPCRVLGLRTAEKDGYAAARIAFGVVAERKLSKGELGTFEPGAAPPRGRDSWLRGPRSRPGAQG